MLFAVLTASVLLAIGLSIFNLTVKELVLSSSGRESQFAFYAADTGAECALYWDLKGKDVFATSTNERAPVPTTPDCVDSLGQQQLLWTDYDAPGDFVPYSVTDSSGHVKSYSPGRGLNYAVTQFSLNIPTDVPLYCAIVTVIKDSSSGILTTTVDSRGYNTPCSDTIDQNRLERALKVSY